MFAERTLILLVLSCRGSYYIVNILGKTKETPLPDFSFLFLLETYTNRKSGTELIGNNLLSFYNFLLTIHGVNQWTSSDSICANFKAGLYSACFQFRCSASLLRTDIVSSRSQRCHD